ncbi:MAG: D-glycero-beta-D-manno-heptose-7-phosphate kinase [Deltaproteobacteria bacterium]|nr:MAG: D-glycero-beta-D-manno-heptose-7-phosphate kinase [Deltaproteobacteria bacterium]
MKKILNQKRALEIIKNFPRSKVLVVGDIMVDHFIWGKVARISPEAPVPVVEIQSDTLLLGGCANVLHNIFSLGGKVYGAGVIGADDMGERLLLEFRNRQINTDGIVVEANRPTTLKTRIVAHGQQVVRFDQESRLPIRPSSVEKIMKYIRKLRNDLGAIVISDYNKGVVTRYLLDSIRQVISGKGIPVCVDPKQNDFFLYKGFDIITPNHHEAGRAAGMDIIDSNDIVKIGKTILEKFDFKALLVTRGEEGMNLFESNDKTTHTAFPAEAREVFDVTGAGDTVIGVLALCVASGATFKEAAALANIAAGIVVGKVGTATISLDELKEVL